MKIRNFGRRLLAVGVALVTVGIATGRLPSASSQTAGTAPTVFACSRNNGEKLVRIVQTEAECGTHETLVQLSPGAQGPAGAAGRDGTNGAHVFHKGSGSVAITSDQQNPTEILRLAPAAGTYMVIAKVLMGSKAGTCRLRGPGAIDDIATWISPYVGGENASGTTTLPLAATGEIATGESVAVLCDAAGRTNGPATARAQIYLLEIAGRTSLF